MADQSPQELKYLDRFSQLLDTQFRIPFTRIRFGIDFLIGLVPVAGDIISFLFSGGMVLTMAKYGASGNLIARMIGNIILDTTVGAIPIVGDTFDLFFKSNRRNYHLLRAHYGEEAYEGSAWKIIIPVLFILIAVFIGTVWLIIKMIIPIWQWIIS